ncbi:MAG: CheR family methyltransferase [Bdellovibrio sp.]
MVAVKKPSFQKLTVDNRGKATALSQMQYEFIRQQLLQATGIELGSNKQALVESRLLKRLSFLKLKDFSQYIMYLKNNHGEYIYFINCLTTNKTNWFREDKHFSYLVNHIIPENSKANSLTFSDKKKRPLYLWSAACSTGEEVYSLAMAIKECSLVGNNFRILGTDINTEALDIARSATYSIKNIELEIPNQFRQKNLENLENSSEAFFKVSSDILENVKFRNYNLIADDLPTNFQFDVIFLRNVLIYFSRPTIETVINRVLRYLRPGGYLFIGHTESLNKLSHPLVQVSESVFQLPS